MNNKTAVFFSSTVTRQIVTDSNRESSTYFIPHARFEGSEESPAIGRSASLPLDGASPKGTGGASLYAGPL